MKHNLKVTVYLVLLFLIAQIIGLAVIFQHIDKRVITETGEVKIINNTKELAFDTQRPETKSSTELILFLSFAILFGTALMLLLIRFRKRRIIKGWFFLAVVMCITYSLGSFINEWVALIIGILFAYYKLIKPNFIIHNIAEVLIYGAIGAIFVPIEFMNIWAAIIILIIISIYDAIAVWQSKHMVKLAKFQSESKTFAGLMIPYKKNEKENLDTNSKSKRVISTKASKSSKKSKNDEEVKEYKKVPKKEDDTVNAILGGGDIAFPLIFIGTWMKLAVLKYSLFLALFTTGIIVLTTTLALILLLVKAEKNKFYPAMPFISAGCLIGLSVVYLMTLIV
jgi:presenilin-like A22 family membrane protease